MLTWSLRPSDSTRSFYGRRFARIYLSHFVTWAIAGIIAFTISRVSLTQIISSLTLVQAWIPDHNYYFAPNSVSWSLSCEVFFYALFPFAVRPIIRASHRTRVALVALLVVSMAVLQLSTLAIAGQSVADYTSFATWLIYIFPVTRIFEFLLGVCVAAEILARHSWNVGLRVAAPLAIIGYYLSGCFVSSTVGTWIAVVPYLLLMAGVTYHEREFSAGVPILKWSWMRYLGEVSFCFYLTQLLFLGLLDRIVVQHRLHHAVKYLDFVSAAVLAVLIHQFVEIPAERRLRARFSLASIPAQQTTLR